MSYPHCHADPHPHTDSNWHAHAPSNAGPNAYSHSPSYRLAITNDNAHAGTHTPVSPQVSLTCPAAMG